MIVPKSLLNESLLPKRYIEQIEELLGEEAKQYFDSFLDEKIQGFRLNPLIDIDALSHLPKHDGQVPWCPYGYYYQIDEVVSKHPYYHSGMYYIQEPSAMAPVAAMTIGEGEKILDMCAAPGGKSTYIGGRLNNTGLLVANDISTSRTQTLLKNIEQAGLKNCIVMSEDPEKFGNRFQGFFDQILLDAPCSGEGMFRKDPKLIKSWEERGAAYFAPIQELLLEQAAQCLKPGGILTYSTCTFNTQENEVQILNFLKKHEDFELLDVTEKLPISQGIPIEGQDILKKTGRLWPHRHRGEGHFLAQIKKLTDDARATIHDDTNITGINKISDINYNCLLEFAKALGWVCPSRDSLFEAKDKLLVYEGPSIDTKGLRVLRTGWLLGSVNKQRFEPSQAMAQGLKQGDVTQCLNIKADDYEVVRFLKGETLECDKDNGWYLVTCDGHGIGFAKVVNQKLKNKREVNWRWL